MNLTEKEFFEYKKEFYKVCGKYWSLQDYEKEDIFLNTLFECYKKGKIEEDEEKKYFKFVSKCRCIDRLYKNKQKSERYISFDNEEPSTNFKFSEIEDIVSNILDEKLLRIFDLKSNGYKDSEIADILGRNIDQVKYATRKMKDKIRSRKDIFEGYFN